MLKNLSAMLKNLRRHFQTFKGKAHLVFFIVGLAGLYYFIDKIISTTSGVPDPRFTVAVSIFNTLFVVGLLEVALNLAEVFQEGREIPLFKEFFGADACRQAGVEVVFLSAKLEAYNDADKDLPKGIGQIKLVDPPDLSCEHGIQTLPKGFEHIIPLGELRAALLIDREFRKHGATITITLDEFKHKPLPDQGCVAIGLGYNNVTLNLMKFSPDLYRVSYDTPGNKMSDDVELVNVGTGSTKDGGDYALIARVLRGTLERPIPYIVCAGHTAQATEKACQFLADHWKDLHGMYHRSSKRLNEYSLAVILQYGTGPTDIPYVDKRKFVSISSL